MPAGKRQFTSVYAGLLLLGLFLLYCAYTHYRWATRLVSRGEITTAKVVAIKFSEGYRNDKKRSKYKAYYPEYEFVTKEKAVYRFAHRATSGRPAWRIGQEASVVYDPADPRRVSKIDYWALFLGAILLASLAAPLVVIGGGYFGYLALMKGLPAGAHIGQAPRTGKTKRSEKAKA